MKHQRLVVVVHLLGVPAGRQQGFQQLVGWSFAHLRPDEFQALSYAVVVAIDGHGRDAQVAE